MLNSIVLILSMKTEAIGVDCFSISPALEDSSLLPISTISKHNHKKHIESKYLRKEVMSPKENWNRFHRCLTLTSPSQRSAKSFLETPNYLQPNSRPNSQALTLHPFYMQPVSDNPSPSILRVMRTNGGLYAIVLHF